VRRVRPSRLTLHRNGRVTFAADAAPAAPAAGLPANGKPNGVASGGAGLQGHHASGSSAGNHATNGRTQHQDVPGSTGHVAGPAGSAEDEEQLYASPEELQGKPGTSASDVYSLGILFFDLFFAVGGCVGQS
jgi:hypothetical protein